MEEIIKNLFKTLKRVYTQNIQTGLYTVLTLTSLLLIGSTLYAQNIEWAISAGGPDIDRGLGHAVDGSGNIYQTGFFMGTGTFGNGEPNETTLTSRGSDDIFLAKYNNAGELIWVRQDGGDFWGDTGNGLALDGAGNIYVTGTFQGPATFGTGEANETTLTGSRHNLFLAMYTTSGELHWADQAAGSASGIIAGLARDDSDNIYIAGFFSTSATFGVGDANETTLSSCGASDIFVAKFGPGNLPPVANAGPDQEVILGQPRTVLQITIPRLLLASSMLLSTMLRLRGAKSSPMRRLMT